MNFNSETHGLNFQSNFQRLTIPLAVQKAAVQIIYSKT